MMALAAVSACGARTPLDVVRDTGDAAMGADATRACEETSPAGTVLWRTTLTQERSLTGPLAADADGTTYFARDPALLGMPDTRAPALYALDRCGRVRWSAAWPHFQNRSVLVHAMRVGPNLLVGDGDLQAFDAATGRHGWTLDLVQLARTLGIGDVTGSNALRRLVADASGVVYAMIQSPEQLGVLRVDASGAARLVLRAPLHPNASDVTDMVLDAAGHLVFAVTDTNVSPGPGVLYSFTTDGAQVYALHLAVVDYLDHLTAGDGYVLLGDTGTLVSDAGRTLRTLERFVGPAAVDGVGNIFTLLRRTGDDAGMQRLDPSGTPRWTASVQGGYAFSYTGGPLLGQRSVYSVYYRTATTADGGVTSATVLHAVDRVSGAAARFEFAGSWQGNALLLTGGVVVFAIGGAAVAVSTGGDEPAQDGYWPTPHGGNDQRGAARGR